MVTVAAAGVPRVAPTGEESEKVNVSLGSIAVSCRMGMLTVLEVSFEAKLSVPEVVV